MEKPLDTSLNSLLDSHGTSQGKSGSELQLLIRIGKKPFLLSCRWEVILQQEKKNAFERETQSNEIQWGRMLISDA